MHSTALLVALVAALRPALAEWSLTFYPDGAVCTGDPTIYLVSGVDSENSGCRSGAFTHDISAAGIEAAGKSVHIYSDQACLNEVANFATDGCQITPADSPVAAVAVRAA